ncbi:hypothetical protein JRI60_21720 [Archangium violaceum]|uniref:hypothetical protein n=1 Tax=Archangium violaceum TaxID=83451 RepID=UPI001950C7CD|nr:hypothetical protein [Archangium violaceum]QRO01448.1 hypothetical protein JRI60_21720 [Archangium violaceum]
MNRRFVPWLLFTLCLSVSASAQTRGPSSSASSTPPWLPRSAFLGTYIREHEEQLAILPQARVQWELVFYQGYRDVLALLIEPMAAFAAVKPDTVVEGSSVPMTSLQLYSLVLGVGYRSRSSSGLEWGFQLGTGPAWYGARFRGGSKAQESYFVGLLDGRAQVGYRFGPVSLGVVVGYGDLYNYRRTSLARPYTGGPQFGLYADWR